MPTEIQIHNENVQKMHENFAKTGRWIDPVSGKQFPAGVKLKLNPNRQERRRLAKWRERSDDGAWK